MSGIFFVPPQVFDQELEFARMTANQWQLIGAYCGFLGCVNSIAWLSVKRSRRMQFSMSSALLVFVNVGAILGIISALDC